MFCIYFFVFLIELTGKEYITDTVICCLLADCPRQPRAVDDNGSSRSRSKIRKDTIMEQCIFDENNGLWYELHGDYYLPCLSVPQEKKHTIGIWGRRQEHYLRQERRALYDALYLKGELNRYLAETDNRAERMLCQLTAEMAEQEGVTEKLKAANQMEWVRAMNNIRNRAEEIVWMKIIINN